MSTKGLYNTSTRRCTPLGSIHDVETSAAGIRRRLATMPSAPDSDLTVFVEDGLVYAVRSTSLIGSRVAPARLVGVYTAEATARDIEEDLEHYALTSVEEAA